MLLFCRQHFEHFSGFILPGQLHHLHLPPTGYGCRRRVAAIDYPTGGAWAKFRRVSAKRKPDTLVTGALPEYAETIKAKASGTPQVICFGEILHDLLSRIPDADETNADDWEVFMGGCPSNVAGCLAALDTPVAFVGNVGDDSTGKACTKEMQGRGVDVSGITIIPSRPTRRIFVRRSSTGERNFVGYDGDNELFADTVQVDLDVIPNHLFSSARVFVTGTMGLAFPDSGSSVECAIKRAKMNNMLVVIDVNWRDRIWAHVPDADARIRIRNIVALADVIKVSVEDIAFLLDDDFVSKALQNPQAVREALGAGRHGLIVTAGEKGASCIFHEKGSDAPIVLGKADAFVPPTGVVDTTGAGDAFVAAFLSELLKEANASPPSECFTDARVMKRVMDFAVKVAGVVVGGAGAIEPLFSREQISAIANASVPPSSDVTARVDIL